MADEPEVIRDQMQETRTALTQKIEALEQQVSSTVQTATATVAETVQTATATVAETVQTVKDTVQDTVGTVKETVEDTVKTVKHGLRDAFDLTGHVERHPWAAIAGSVAVGYVMGRLLGPSQASEPRRSSEPWTAPSYYRPEPESPPPAPFHNGANGAGKKEEDAGPSLMSGLLDTFSEPLNKLKDMGISTMMALARDMLTRNMQGEIGERVQTWMNDVTEKMGVKPLSESILPAEEHHSSSEGAPPPSGGGPQGEASETSGKKARSVPQARARR